MTISGTPDFQNITQPQGGIDVLYENVLPNGSTAYTVDCSAVTGVYPYLVVSLLLTVANTCTYTANSVNSLPGPGITRYIPPNTYINVYIPYGGKIGDLPQIGLTFANAVAGGGVNIQVWGQRSYPQGLMQIGAFECQNSLAAVWTPANGTTTIIAAPPAGGAILLGTIVPPIIEPQAALVISRCAITKQGAFFNVGWAMSDGSDYWQSSPDSGPGLLCDPATAVSQIGTALPTASFAGVVFYDILTFVS